jgi:hypothetical protein
VADEHRKLADGRARELGTASDGRQTWLMRSGLTYPLY